MTIDEKLDYILSNMATKDDIQRLDTKVDALDTKVNELDNKVNSLDTKIDTTKQDLINRMDKLEHDILNTCLGYTDDQNESIITKLDNIQSTINTAARLKTIDNDLYNLVNKRIDEVVERVERLEKIS